MAIMLSDSFPDRVFTKSFVSKEMNSFLGVNVNEYEEKKIHLIDVEIIICKYCRDNNLINTRPFSSPDNYFLPDEKLNKLLKRPGPFSYGTLAKLIKHNFLRHSWKIEENIKKTEENRQTTILLSNWMRLKRTT